jgi:serine/threonine protein phosphatase PrpC
VSIGVVEFAAATHTGMMRRTNEDSHLARPPLFVVADGMGGSRAGEVASQLAVETFERLAGTRGLPEELLRTTIGEANARIHDAAERDGSKAGMGTTITAALVADAAVSFGHVGDSRAYLWRDGVLQQLSDDHSLVGELVRRGALTPEEAERHPQKNIITRTVGTEPGLEVDTWTLEAADGDVFLLASDGLNNMIRDGDIAAILGSAPSLSHAARELVKAANVAGGVDNITALLFRVGTGPPVTAPPAGDSELLPTLLYPDEPQLAPTRRRGVRRLLFVLSAVVVSAALALGGLALLRQSHFVGATADGHVAIYQGVPVDLVGDLRLYRRIRTSPIPVAALTAAERAKLFDHSLLSLDDAEQRIDRLPAAAYYGATA